MDNLLIHPKDTYCIKKDEFLHGVDKCEVYNKYTGVLLTVMSYKEYTDVLGASLNTAGYLNLKIGNEEERRRAFSEPYTAYSNNRDITNYKNVEQGPTGSILIDIEKIETEEFKKEFQKKYPGYEYIIVVHEYREAMLGTSEFTGNMFDYLGKNLVAKKTFYDENREIEYFEARNIPWVWDSKMLSKIYKII